jgi:hypothetical protein
MRTTSHVFYEKILKTIHVISNNLDLIFKGRDTCLGLLKRSMHKQVGPGRNVGKVSFMISIVGQLQYYNIFPH